MQGKLEGVDRADYSFGVNNEFLSSGAIGLIETYFEVVVNAGHMVPLVVGDHFLHRLVFEPGYFYDNAFAVVAQLAFDAFNSQVLVF